MSTRGMVGVVVDGKLLGAYNHFDSYPEGLGAKVAEEAKVIAGDLDRYRDLARKLRVVSEDAKPTPQEREKWAAYSDPSVRGGSEWYSVMREAQGSIKTYLEMGDIPDGASFITDSLFCEYAYILDLDKVEFHFLVGFNKRKGLQYPLARTKKRDSGYYGCALGLVTELSSMSVAAMEVAAKAIEYANNYRAAKWQKTCSNVYSGRFGSVVNYSSNYPRRFWNWKARPADGREEREFKSRAAAMRYCENVTVDHCQV